MNKKRLYKSNALLHPRGEKVRSELQGAIRALFLQYARFHPRDLSLLLIDTIMTQAALQVYTVPVGRKKTETA